MIKSIENRQLNASVATQLQLPLPKIRKNHNKENFLPSNSLSKIHNLTRIYNLYKSNARLFQLSPYTNSTQRKKIINRIKPQLITRIPKTTNQQLERLGHQIKVNIYEDKVKHSFQIYCDQTGDLVRNIMNELETPREFRSFIKNKKNIIGFETIEKNLQTDYILSLANIRINFKEISLKPIHKIKRNNKIMLRDFTFIKCLGCGGFSVVYLVRGNFNNKYYALKLIDKQFIIKSQREGIIQNERFILGELGTCQFTTKLQFCFQTLNHFALVIQYCSGGQLFYQLKKVKKMNQQQAKFYFLEILVGIQYLHSKKIIYRDLKPQNLLIDQEGHIKIADFGLSKPVDNNKQLSYSFCGSPEYMAPQMLEKKGHNYCLDYYCLGALLYELIFGIPPYYSLDHEQIYQSILKDQLTFPENVCISQQLKDLMSRLLEKQPKQRLGALFGSKQILFHPWIGKVNRQVIENRKLNPPFIPNLYNFNFDETQIKNPTQQFLEKIKLDISMGNKFQTFFNDEFYYQSQQIKELTKERKQISLDCKKFNHKKKLVKKQFSLNKLKANLSTR